MSGMNRLSTEKRVMILNLLVEGMSMRSISRIVGVSINTVTKLLVAAGEACAAYHDEVVRDVESRRIQCDEIWSFCYAKARTAPKDAGDVWTWTAMCADSQLILAWEVGDRSAHTATSFMDNLEHRLTNRVQLTTDGHRAYIEAVDKAFHDGVDDAMLVKLYGDDGRKSPERKPSPSAFNSARVDVIEGKPDPAHISTSHVERQKLTMRMSMRRFTRLTNAFSKKIENHAHAVALHYMHHNFCRIHRSLRCTPAMAAGLTGTLHDMAWIVGLIDDRAPKPNRPKTYRKRISK